MLFVIEAAAGNNALLDRLAGRKVVAKRGRACAHLKGDPARVVAELAVDNEGGGRIDLVQAVCALACRKVSVAVLARRANLTPHGAT